MGIMVFAVGLAVLFNFIILRVKWNKGRYSDVAVDFGMLVALNAIFGGSILGVLAATAGSTLISLYLMVYPVILFNDIEELDKEECDELSASERLDRSFERMKTKVNDSFKDC